MDRGTGEVKIRRFVAVEGCGNILHSPPLRGIINPMIVDGQIHGGLTRGMEGGVTHIDIPMTPEKVWRLLKEKGAAE
jgi:hypothetical protein